MVREIREGTLALRLLRPIHPLASYSAESLAAMPLRALISLPLALVMLLVSARHGLTHDPVSIFCFVLSLAGAWLLNLAISCMIGTLGLYLESSLSVHELWLGCFMLLSGYLVPLSLFPRWLERAARALPFAYLQAVPVEMLTGLRDRHAALRGLVLQFSYALTALALMLLLWRRAVRRFHAYGG
jgi:ABC-2 type transport system permease protein